MIALMFWALLVGFWLGNALYAFNNEPAMAFVAYIVCALYAGVDFFLCVRRLFERSFQDG